MTRLTKNSKILTTIIKAIQDKKGENIVSLDLRKIHEAVADFFVICEASTSTQVKAIADSIEHLVKETLDEAPYRHEGHQSAQWVLIDYVNVVVHVFQKHIRHYYDIESLWGDAKTTVIETSY